MAAQTKQRRKRAKKKVAEEIRRQCERDAYMKKAIAAAVKWATKELARVRKEGLLPGEAADHILAEVGRRWNIGAMNAVEKKLDLHPTQPDDEEDDEEEEDEEEEEKEKEEEEEREKEREKEEQEEDEEEEEEEEEEEDGFYFAVFARS